jgi:predicted ATPase
MIARITLENFFSFGRSTTVELNQDINVLVGINGSGKSNLLKAIKLLYDSVIGEGFEKTFLKDWSGFNAVGNLNKKQEDYIKLEFEFDREALEKAVDHKGYKFAENPIYEITILRSGSTSYYLKEKIYSESIHNGQSPFIFMDMENTEGLISTREEGSVGFQRYPQKKSQVTFKSTELVLRQISDPDRFYPLFTLKRALEKLAVYDYFDTTLKSVIRQPGSYGTEERLMFNGQNLMSILLRIKNHHSLDYEKIEKYIQKINPNFKDINFDILGSKLFLVLREEFLSKSVSIEHISDGSLRYLLMLSILFNPERGNLLCIDEPEIGLHPDMINSISNALKTASRDNTQLIIATHSPLLLNLFELDEILIFEKDDTNQTVVSIRTEDDFEDWNEDFLVGQLWLRGLIGGKRW